jgi:hypothetical protein
MQRATRAIPAITSRIRAAFRQSAAIFATSVALAPGVCGAAQWIESDDAGSYPQSAQVTRGTGSLAGITGQLLTPVPDSDNVDLFAVHVADPRQFSARATFGNPNMSGRLFLLDQAGRGVYGVTQDSAPYLPPNQPISPQSTGLHFLAVTVTSIEPYGPKDEFGFDRTIFASAVGSGVFGPATNEVVSGWGGTISTVGGIYSIALTGAEFAAPVPEPYEWAMMLAGLGLVGRSVRRRERLEPGYSVPKPSFHL